MIPVLIIIGILAVLFIVYLFMIKPRTEHKTSVEPLKVDYAHRGLFGRNETVENTMEAFREAERYGFGIELDVHLSSDNEIIVFHDDTLERLCGRPERVDELTASELSWAELKGTYDRIPLLDDVLNEIDKKIPLCIELKGADTRLCEKVAEMMDRYDRYYSVESFNPLLLNWFRKNKPRVVRGQLTTNLFCDGKGQSLINKIVCTTMMLNFLSKPDYISFDERHEHQLPVVICEKLYKSLMFVWTVKDKKSYEKHIEKGRIVIFQEFVPENGKVAK